MNYGYYGWVSKNTLTWQGSSFLAVAALRVANSHFYLDDVIGLISGLGEAADGINALIY